MRTFILFCLTCIIGTGAFLCALTVQNKLPAFIVGFGYCFSTTLSKKQVDSLLIKNLPDSDCQRGF